MESSIVAEFDPPVCCIFITWAGRILSNQCESARIFAGYAPIIANLQTNRNETGGVLDNGLPPDSPENLADTD